ncbi:hypothetical protein F443_06857 [Phytophthora nicotianae P1569]|uniref:Uncharacterized protein n=4 Tax=Phytophthora nicotianae TaxID=4792 RepID=V9FCN1_PHYNI|nr:hypothetical protein F443_06857 [Phytophthora nicotianae P1569]ETO77956.1 hypothetical protein F444_06923 [Phytophthora nicotianae P1976]
MGGFGAQGFINLTPAAIEPATIPILATATRAKAHFGSGLWSIVDSAVFRAGEGDSARKGEGHEQGCFTLDGEDCGNGMGQQLQDHGRRRGKAQNAPRYVDDELCELIRDIQMTN